MKIKLKTQLVGQMTHGIGDIVDLPDADAERLLERDLAELVVEPKPKKKVVKKNATNTY